MTDLEIQNVTVDAEDLEAALDAYDSDYGAAYAGDVMLFDDGDDDTAVYVANRDEGTVTKSYEYTQDLRDRVDEVLVTLTDFGTVTFIDDRGSSITLDASEPFEVVQKNDDGHNTHVVGFDEESVVDTVDGGPNSFPDSVLDGDWDHDWYFGEIENDVQIE